MWLERNIIFYTEEKKKYDIALQDYYQRNKDYCNWYNSQRHNSTVEERKEVEKSYNEYKTNFKVKNLISKTKRIEFRKNIFKHF